MDDTSGVVVVFVAGDPLLLEGGLLRELCCSDPGQVLAVWRLKNADCLVEQSA